jgi:AraC family transcriptional regulator of adaptative response / DNA-3-methyladenine glycosylase II
MADVTLRLPYVGVLDWEAALIFLGRRAIDGVEEVASGVYRRSVSVDDSHGTIQVHHDARGGALVVTFRGPSALAPVVTGRVRRMFDLDADAAAISSLLHADSTLRPDVPARPAVRVFRGWDGFEVAVRSVVSQQVSVERARRLNGELVLRCGVRLPDANDGPLHRLFPTPAELLDADLSDIGMPGARVETITAVARAASADPRLFERGRSLDETIARLRAIRGIGDWTAHYIAMRACGEPDAFPASDVGLLRGAADADGRRPTPVELLERAERWRPWRAYAAHWLWARDVENGRRGRGPAATRFNRKSRSAPDRSRAR